MEQTETALLHLSYKRASQHNRFQYKHPPVPLPLLEGGREGVDK